MTFLGYIVTGHGIKADERTVEAIRTWPVQRSIHNVRSFHGLASFYKRFIRNSSTIRATMTDIIKGLTFK